MLFACGLILPLGMKHAARVAGRSLPTSAKLIVNLLVRLEVAGCLRFTGGAAAASWALTQQLWPGSIPGSQEVEAEYKVNMKQVFAVNSHELL